MNTKGHLGRFYLLLIFFITLLLGLLSRVVWLTIIKKDFLADQGAVRSVRILDVPAYRGMITDRKGMPLAVSTPVMSLWVNPQKFKTESKELAYLARYLDTSPKKILQTIHSGSSRGFLYLKRHIAPPIAKKIDQLTIPGVHFQQEFKRYYPESDSTSHLLGFTNIDDKGQEGVELLYQSWLAGVNGQKKVIKDRKGHIIEEVERIREPRPGHDLRLSIDRRIQYIAYHELSKTLKKFGAQAGSVVVVKADTGELLAVANAPSFNPNQRSSYNPDLYRNRAFTDTFEPGSVIKPLSFASAFESGNYSSDTIIDTRPSWMMVNGHAIRDLRNYGILTVREVLQHSSNVGVSKMVLSSPPEQIVSFFKKCGFGERSETGYPGEAEGHLPRAQDIDSFEQATMGFGYGLSVSAIQMAKAYILIANHGKMVPLSIIYQNRPPPSEQIISKATAEQILSMMEAVVGSGGTGKKARVSGYRVAGKTGTARIAGKNGYDVDRHLATFAGVAPVSNPQLIVMVVIYEPTKESYYGGTVAAPLFSTVMSGALRVMNIAPDKPIAS